MKTRYLLFSMVLVLGCQLTALGQTCAQKIAQCQQGCTGLPNPKLVQPCRINCTKTACGTEHTSTPPPTAPPFPWDVVAPNDGTEQPNNGFIRNPQWTWALANPNPLLDICDWCPCDNQDPSSWITQNCTSQSLHKNAPNNPFCYVGAAFGGDALKAYHMNWVPVEIDGSLRFEDHSTVFDNDYQFDITSGNSLLTKSRPEVHVEFDSTETVNEWDRNGTWWDNFHHVVDSLKSKDKLQPWFGNKFGIVIGMLGIDMEHAPHPELHPVYAMFINLGPEGPGPVGSLTKPDHWAFFVRNWGNEGYCGSGDEPLNEYREIGIPLPETDIVSSRIVAYAHGDYSLDQCGAESSVIGPDAKGLMVFNLPPATGKCGLVGDLFIRRRPSTIGGSWESTGSSRRSTVVSVSSEGGEDIDPRLMARIAKLDPVARQELYNQLSDIMKETSRRPNTPIRAINITPPSSSRVAEKRPQFTGQGLRAVPNPAFEAKQAKQRQLIDAFLKAHGVQ